MIRIGTALSGLHNGFDAPKAVVEGRASNSVADGWSPIASHYIELELKAGESKELVFILGYAENPEEEKWEAKGINKKSRAKATIQRFNSTEAVDKAFSGLGAYWEALLSKYTVETSGRKA